MLAQVKERERESLGGNRYHQQMAGTVYNVIYYWHKQKDWADAILPDKLTFAVWVCVCVCMGEMGTECYYRSWDAWTMHCV